MTEVIIKESDGKEEFGLKYGDLKAGDFFLIGTSNIIRYKTNNGRYCYIGNGGDFFDNADGLVGKITRLSKVTITYEVE